MSTRLYLLDTNICVFTMNYRPPVVRERLQQVIEQGHTVAISSITLHELWYGVHRSTPNRVQANAERLGKFAAALVVQPFDAEAAAKAATIRADLASTGQPIGPYDVLIAGHALNLEATLVTNNAREFERVDGLLLEDWIK